MKRVGPDELKNKIVDCHTHTVGFDFSNFIFRRFPISNNILEFSQTVKKCGVDYFVSMPFCSPIYYDYKKYWETGKLFPSDFCQYPFEIENQFMLECIDSLEIENALPFLGFSLSDNIKEQEQAIESLIQRYPVYGLKYHPKIDRHEALDIPILSKFIEIAKEYNIPITIHTEKKDMCDPSQVIALAYNNPDVRFCAAHMGDFDTSFIKDALTHKLSNLFFDCAPLIYKCFKASATNNIETILNLHYDNPIEVYYSLFEMFPSKLLWGSDSPWTMVGHFENIHGATYEDEANIITTFTYRNTISDNTNAFLFGIQ